jgi:hypothetical protein
MSLFVPVEIMENIQEAGSNSLCRHRVTILKMYLLDFCELSPDEHNEYGCMFGALKGQKGAQPGTMLI